ncbi:peptide ligase PGM1-related protein [Oryzobacter telluris]|uniref:peptide ligase PGM1-related protein n=1 Tax=Oryzobacter telluris TaxID=3149179 RepID=UPI00370D3AE3
MATSAGPRERLDEALRANSPGSSVEHVVVALPSFSMGETLLSHYAPRLAALEHRYLLASVLTGRIPGAHFVLVTSGEPGPAVLDYYARLARPDRPHEARRRLSCVVVPDPSPRGVSAKLLDRPDLLAGLRDLVGGRPVLVEPWNVTADEVEVARALGAPLNGTHPALWPLGFKSSGRRLFVEAGVPVPCGVEDVHDVVEVAAAIASMRRTRPHLDRVVVKQDNSGAGDGNWVMPTRDGQGCRVPPERLRTDALADLPDWFTRDLAAGGVVEELVAGQRVTSPSAQVDLRPDGEVRLLSTHEQVLGGDNGQVFTGCRFPADPAYAAVVGRHALAVARRVAREGALGRVAVDFVAVRRRRTWAVYGLELNLRKGGTTHPFAALRHLVPGSYDPDPGRWVADADGRPRCYRSSDAVLDAAWLGLDPAHVIEGLGAAGLAFDHATGTGIVLHSLSSLAVDGRVGVTAIGRSVAEAEDLFEALPVAVHGLTAHGTAAGPMGTAAAVGRRHSSEKPSTSTSRQPPEPLTVRSTAVARRT